MSRIITTKWKKPVGFIKCFISMMSSNPHKHSANFLLDLERSLRRMGRGAHFPTDQSQKDGPSLFKKTDLFDQGQSFR